MTKQTKREKIIEILRKHMYHPVNDVYGECADEITALPIEVPTEEEIKPDLPIIENDAYFFYKGVRKTIEEIKRRNQ